MMNTTKRRGVKPMGIPGTALNLLILLMLGHFIPAAAQTASPTPWATNGGDIYNTNGGNVGIGTKAPVSPLEVQAPNGPLTLSQAGVGAKSTIQAVLGKDLHLSANAKYAGAWNRLDTAAPSWNLYLSLITDQFGLRRAAPAAGTITWTDLLRVTSAGWFGVGTTSPNFKLDVQGGQINASDGLCIGGLCKGSWGDIGGSQWTTGGNGISYTGGNVGVGTTAPTSKLHVAGNVNAAGLCISGNCKTDWSQVGASQWATGGTNISYSAGNVGVGTATPSFDLDVRGQFGASSQGYPTSLAGGIGGQLYTVHGSNNWGLVVARAAADVGGGNLTFYHTRSANAAVKAALVANDSLGRITFQGPIDDATVQSGAELGSRVSAVGTNLASHLYFSTLGATGGLAERMRVDASGNVGIGTAAPGYKLDVAGPVNASGLCIAGACRSSWGEVGASQWATGSAGISYTGGNVGIGTAAPQYRLQVDGGIGVYNAVDDAFVGVLSGTTNEHATFGWSRGGRYAYIQGGRWATAPKPVVLQAGGGSVGVGKVPGAGEALSVLGNISAAGDITATGTIAAKYQDVAEWVPAQTRLAAGTVVVLDPEASNRVMASAEAYDTRVAGVVSETPGIILGEAGEGKVKVATTGRVRVKVDAERAPIRIGDLLVTSGGAGMAMKSEPVTVAGRRMHAPGTIVGKALEPLAGGVGEILVLLSLQ